MKLHFQNILRRRLLCAAFAVAIPLFLVSCHSHDTSSTSSLCVVERTDYMEEIVADGNTESVNTTVLMLHDLSGAIKSIIEDGTTVHAGDTVIVVESPEIEEELDNLHKTLESILAEKARTEATYALESAIQQAQMEANIASASLETLDSLQQTFAPPLQRRISDLKLRRSHLQQERARRNLDAMEIAHRIDMQRINTYQNFVYRRITDVRKKMDDLVLRAPQDGLVILSKNWSTDKPLKLGDEVWDEMPLAILPDMSQMQVLMRMPENDYKRISLGDSVFFSFPSIPDNLAWGRISKKIPVGVEATEGSKVRLFDVTATVDTMLAPILPQTNTHASIRLRTLRDTLVVPSVSIFNDDSLRVVFVRTPNGHIEQREVELAASSLTQTAIAQGVREGETLLLLRPATHRIRKKTFLHDNTKDNEK